MCAHVHVQVRASELLEAAERHLRKQRQVDDTPAAPALVGSIATSSILAIGSTALVSSSSGASALSGGAGA